MPDNAWRRLRTPERLWFQRAAPRPSHAVGVFNVFSFIYQLEVLPYEFEHAWGRLGTPGAYAWEHIKTPLGTPGDAWERA